ncbi:hypothetical protein [Microcoleus sp. CAWBG640]|uniref:glycosyltransferase n=1 Tax=Microcoleus sp. CAWBG640 TaxID=2841653 RepID=UPI00312B4A3D
MNCRRPIQRLLNSIPSPSPNQLADVTLRIYSPWNFAASTSAQTWVFAATEWGIVTNLLLEAIGVNSITETPINSESKIITPSAWSKAGLIRSGVQGDRIAIVPHGADTDIYYPPSQQQRQTLRQTFGWEDYFIFLNIGGQTDRKGIRPLLKAFIEGENLFILDPDWKHLIQLMQTLIEQPAFIAKARLAGPRFVSENFTWKHAVDKLLDVISNPLTSELLFLSCLSLCPLCSLWFNHSDTTGNDMRSISVAS